MFKISLSYSQIGSSSVPFKMVSFFKMVSDCVGDSDVGDFMMVTDLRCWWQNHYVGDFFRYVGDFFSV